MTPSEALLDEAAFELSQSFLRNYPVKSARFIEKTDAKAAATLLQRQPLHLLNNVWQYIPVGTADEIFAQFSDDVAKNMLSQLDIHLAVGLLSRLEKPRLDELYGLLNKDLVSEFEALLNYPENTAGRMMSTHVQAFSEDLTVAEVCHQLKRRKIHSQDVLFVLDDNHQVSGEIELNRLLQSNDKVLLKHLSTPLKTTLSALDNNDTVIEKFEGYRTTAIPVLDLHQHLIGIIRFVDVYQTTKEELASDMQTMVGASKEERALSSSVFAVRKRLPWLQINLLTAFAAAAVVGAFEGLISEITALAILLPVAAGQSGNAGAQALAVTMRGLTLREITTRHWTKVFAKELMTGLLNGIAIAVTCGLGVYVWSQSTGLALVIALAMISSLVIACGAGALVPIVLKKVGLDPAQSSSIVLTTITDIAGFMSFLGIALMLSDMLPRG